MQQSQSPFQSLSLSNDAVFATAPRAGAVKKITAAACLIAAGILVVELVIFSKLPASATIGHTVALAVMGLIVVALLASWFVSRIRNLTLTGQTLSIKLTFWTARFDLAGLRSVEADANALKGSLRTFGNGGVGAFHGYFWSKRMGKFHAYVTDPSRAVVLRWVDKCVVVSPEDAQQFVEAAREVREARKRAGL